MTNDKILSWQDIRQHLKHPLILATPVTLHIFRHAQSTVNAEKRIAGSQDVDLTPEGEAQARVLGTQLDPEYSLAFASGLKRAYKTLDLAITSGNISVGSIHKDKRLNERNLGILEGGKLRFIPEYAAGNLNYAPENGESYAQLSQRIFSFLIDLARFTQMSEVNNILICSHIGSIRILVSIITENTSSVDVLGQKFGNTELIKLEWHRLIIPEFIEKGGIFK
ncbi:phosphoglycerate mutase family protein [Coleofasciculus chthonoplastes PCC 7420]|uniref:phosphoglycerate mutase (2,3-diphosphoglycerate-dependent) n=1 Tax=Coleofasciculus chthonoplastes PCC 7420 TaxID=118168 RepID=B4VU11_9CYAN|nr:phosphoglycerate mutase family protein [Coleofasciculus chthonoplastes]EDX74523.1 phosphoglycerate mutase family protein [Coleofasciculus chthonoplastes PCC 7420]